MERRAGRLGGVQCQDVQGAARRVPQQQDLSQLRPEHHCLQHDSQRGAHDNGETGPGTALPGHPDLVVRVRKHDRRLVRGLLLRLKGAKVSESQKRLPDELTS